MSTQTTAQSQGKIAHMISAALAAQQGIEKRPFFNSAISQPIASQPGIRAYRAKRKAHNKNARRARRMTRLRG